MVKIFKFQIILFLALTTYSCTSSEVEECKDRARIEMKNDEGCKTATKANSRPPVKEAETRNI